MCFHNSMSADAVTLGKRYNAKVNEGVNFSPIYYANGFDFPEYPILTSKNELELFQWGLIPPWCGSTEQATLLRSSTLNARIETLTEKPSFREAVNKRRCIVPSTGFFEWQTLNKKKYPYFISIIGTAVFSMAGIWEEWLSPDMKMYKTFTIVTTQANELMSDIHNTKKRMPVILSPALEAAWLDMSIAVNEFEKPIASAMMQAHTISRAISQPNANQSTINKLFTYPELNQLNLF